MASRRRGEKKEGGEERKKLKAKHVVDCHAWEEERKITNDEVDCDPEDVQKMLNLMVGSMKRKSDDPKQEWLGKKISELESKGFSFVEELRKRHNVPNEEGKLMDESFAKYLLANPHVLTGEMEKCSSSAIRILKDLIRQYQPDVIFLSETKVANKRMVFVQRQIKYVGGIIEPAIGKSGGLALFWKEGIDVEIISSSRHLINGKVNNYPADSSWFFSFVYGHHVAHKRKIIWDEL
ncbi:hypothetical protein FRX31_033366 [Thalictrum thalictroides]|uniref:Endonuclease/exonuclease/phosphatase domain-containing protein n=1 Tax=Thalictrum thalictroides TaxID=46969 RepID=A0A7J6UWQ4_THATH|nr:hypothetical protein FRX31_033366 [Thalictrum thalictroides]